MTNSPNTECCDKCYGGSPTNHSTESVEEVCYDENCKCHQLTENGYENATLEQKEEIMKEVAREAIAEQRAVMKSKENWETRFDEEFQYTIFFVNKLSGGRTFIDPEQIKSFFKAELLSLVEDIEGMRVDITPHINKYPDDQEMQESVASEITKYNQALSDAISLIKKRI